MNKNIFHPAISKFLRFYKYGKSLHKFEQTRNLKLYSHLTETYPAHKEKSFLFTSFVSACIRTLINDHANLTGTILKKYTNKCLKIKGQNVANKRFHLFDCSNHKVFQTHFILKRFYAWNRESLEGTSQRMQIKEYKKKKNKLPPLCKYCPRNFDEEKKGKSFLYWFRSLLGFGSSKKPIPKGRKRVPRGENKDKSILMQQAKIAAGTVECENELRQTDSSLTCRKKQRVKQKYVMSPQSNTKIKYLKQPEINKNAIYLEDKTTKSNSQKDQNEKPEISEDRGPESSPPNIDKKMAELCKKYNLDDVWLSDSPKTLEKFEKVGHDSKSTKTPNPLEVNVANEIPSSKQILPKKELKYYSEEQLNVNKQNVLNPTIMVAHETLQNMNSKPNIDVVKPAEGQESYSKEKTETSLNGLLSDERNTEIPKTLSDNMEHIKNTDHSVVPPNNAFLSSTTPTDNEGDNTVFVPLIKKVPINLNCDNEISKNTEKDSKIDNKLETSHKVPNKNNDQNTFKTFSLDTDDTNKPQENKYLGSSLKEIYARKCSSTFSSINEEQKIRSSSPWTFKHRLRNSKGVQGGLQTKFDPLMMPKSKTPSLEKNQFIDYDNSINFVHPTSKKYTEVRKDLSICEPQTRLMNDSNLDKTPKSTIDIADNIVKSNNKFESLIDQNMDWHTHEKVRNVFSSKQQNPLQDKTSNTQPETAYYKSLDKMVSRANEILANVARPLKSQSIKNQIDNEDESQKDKVSAVNETKANAIHVDKKLENLNNNKQQDPLIEKSILSLPKDETSKQNWYQQSILNYSQETNLNHALTPQETKESKKTYLSKTDSSTNNLPISSNNDVVADDAEFKEVLCCKFNISQNGTSSEKSDKKTEEITNKQYELCLTLSECKDDFEPTKNIEKPSKTVENHKEPKNTEVVHNECANRTLKDANKPTHDRIRNFTTCACQKEKLSLNDPPATKEIEKIPCFMKSEKNLQTPKCDTLLRELMTDKNSTFKSDYLSSNSAINKKNIFDSSNTFEEIRFRYMNRCGINCSRADEENKNCALHLKNYEKGDYEKVTNNSTTKCICAKEKNNTKEINDDHSKEFESNLKTSKDSKEVFIINKANEKRNEHSENTNTELDKNDLNNKQRTVYKMLNHKLMQKSKTNVKKPNKSRKQYVIDSFVLNQFMQMIKSDILKNEETRDKKDAITQAYGEKYKSLTSCNKSKDQMNKQCENSKIESFISLQKGNKRLKMEIPTEVQILQEKFKSLLLSEVDSTEKLHALLSHKADEFCNVMVELVTLFSNYMTSHELLKHESSLKYIQTQQNRINSLKETIKSLQESIGKYFKLSGSLAGNCLAHGDAKNNYSEACELLYTQRQNRLDQNSTRRCISCKATINYNNQAHNKNLPAVSNEADWQTKGKGTISHESEFRNTLIDLIGITPSDEKFKKEMKGLKRQVSNDNT